IAGHGKPEYVLMQSSFFSGWVFLRSQIMADNLACPNCGDPIYQSDLNRGLCLACGEELPNNLKIQKITTQQPVRRKEAPPRRPEEPKHIVEQPAPRRTPPPIPIPEPPDMNS